MNGIYQIKNEQDWSRAVDQFEGKVLVEFFAQWCGFCKREQPILEEALGQIEAAGVQVAQADIDVMTEKSAEYGVSGTPTFILFSDGDEIAKNAGFMDKSDLIAFAMRI